MKTTVTTGDRGRGPGIRAPRREVPRPHDLRPDDLRREAPRRQEPGRLEPGRLVRRRADPDAGRRRPDPGRTATGGLRTRPARPAGPGRPGLPGRPRLAGRPARSAMPPAGRTGPAGEAGQDTSGAGRRPAARTPFILLVLALLGCGLICLLVINTTLAAGSFQISKLRRDNTEATRRVQELQQQVSADASANSIEQRAARLGMRTQPTLDFVNLQTGRRYTTPARVPGVPAVPGYTR